MGFVAVCTAIFDYQPQSDNELEIREGELLYILEKSTEDAWWKAKKRAGEEDEDEPVGLIPNNYVEEAKPTHSAKALYDYSRQTDEEVSFEEDAALEVFDTSDPDWTLVGINGEYGFAPANYIELSSLASPLLQSTPTNRSLPAAPARHTGHEATAAAAASSPTASIQGPAASLARVMEGGITTSLVATQHASNMALPPRQQSTPEASDKEAEEIAPALPRRPPSQMLSSPTTQSPTTREKEPPGILPSPPSNRVSHHNEEGGNPILSPGGFHLYNISEMVSAMGRRRKMPTTLGINIATGKIMLSPEKPKDGPSQEWTADRMTHYSLEGKHVFLELIRPSKSLDLHAGAKDTAEEIVSALGEVAGAVRGEGIREVIAAASSGTGQKKGQILYDFIAQGDDEVTVGAGDDVIIVDDTKSEEWWMVRRLKNGKEGVVPSSYVDITGVTSAELASRTGVNAGRSIVEQNRLEEDRLAKEVARLSRDRERNDSRDTEIKGDEVGPGMKLPDRGSSLTVDEGNRRSSQRDRRTSRADAKSGKPKPDPNKTRMWTDRSGSFKVEAQFIGLADGKIHLHKQNGVKIAVPVTKMAVEDLEYVEKVAGVSLDEDKPLSDIRRRSRQASEGEKIKPTRSGATVEHPKPPQYDWFDFFLKAGVGPHQCERYAQNMKKDSMDESVLPDITPEVLRTLGLKEGDILRVMKFLDNKYGRTGSKSNLRNVSFAEDGSINANDANGSAGGIFAGPDGALRNNTRRGRPASRRQVSDVVDPKAFDRAGDVAKAHSPESKATPPTPAPPREKVQSGFDDDAWEVTRPQPPTTVPHPQSSSAASAPASITPSQPPLSGTMAELSLLSPPLQPAVTNPQPAQPPTEPRVNPQPTTQAATASAPVQQPQPTGAHPTLFSQLNQQMGGVPPAQATFPQTQQISSQPTRVQQLMPPGQGPQFSLGSLLPPPPPPRPLSAPQNFQHNQFGPPPLQPQLTGIPHTSPLQAPMGQSLNDLSQQRFQQQFAQQQLQSQPPGFPQQVPGLAPFSNGVQPQQTGFHPPPPNFQYQQQPYLNGNATGSPFADPHPSFQSSLVTQPSGFAPTSQQGLQPGGINFILPPALQPQPTGYNFQSQQTQSPGFQQTMQTGFGLPAQQNGFNAGFQPPPMPSVPQQATIPPLQPQKTGPAPPVRFGVEAKKLTPQATGRRANLNQATPQNPFGF